MDIFGPTLLLGESGHIRLLSLPCPDSPRGKVGPNTYSSGMVRPEFKTLQIPLEQFLLETDAPDGVPKLEGLLPVTQDDDSDNVQNSHLNHPGNIR